MTAPVRLHIDDITQKGRLVQIFWGFEEGGTGAGYEVGLNVTYPGSGGVYERRLNMTPDSDKNVATLDNLPLPVDEGPGELNITVFMDGHPNQIQTQFELAPTIPPEDSVAVTEINNFPGSAPPDDTFPIEAVAVNANNAPVNGEMEFTLGGSGDTWAQSEGFELEAAGGGKENAIIVQRDVTTPSQEGTQNYCIDVTNRNYLIPNGNIEFPANAWEDFDEIMTRPDDLHPYNYTLVIDEVPDSFRQIDDTN